MIPARCSPLKTATALPSATDPRGLSDASHLEPDGNGGDDHHGPVVDRPLLVAGGQSAPLFEPVDAPFDGLFTNDKFCLSRFGQLSLTWWRYPLRLRGGHSDPQTASLGEVTHWGGSHETAVAHSPAGVRPPRRAATLGPRVSGDPGVGGR